MKERIGGKETKGQCQRVIGSVYAYRVRVSARHKDLRPHSSAGKFRPTFGQLRAAPSLAGCVVRVNCRAFLIAALCVSGSAGEYGNLSSAWGDEFGS